MYDKLKKKGREQTSFYLKHDEKRRRIAQNGYEKVLAAHTYSKRIEEMISVVFPA
ncbi:MAG: glycosyltransferase [Lachnoclostridium sp.]|nr:glycosyltransferase [Lachnoclostridium sp.]